MAEPEKDPPFEGGSQPVTEHPTGIKGGGRGAAQTLVIVLAALLLLAALAWFLVPLFSAGE